MTTIELQPPSVISRATTHLDICLCLLFIGGGLFMCWSLTWGPTQWHSGPSLLLVAGLGVPWPGIGFAWLGYALLLTNRWTRVGGYVLGVILSGFFTLSLLTATFDGRLTSVYALVLVIFATAGQISGGIRSMVAAERKR